MCPFAIHEQNSPLPWSHIKCIPTLTPSSVDTRQGVVSLFGVTGQKK